MKKLILIVTAIVLVFGMNAQKIGVKAGYTMSGYTMNFDKPDGAKMGMGFHAGLVGQMDLKVLKLRADVTYNQLGSILDPEGYINTTDYDYLQVGVYAKKGLGPVYMFVGPYFGYALSGNSKTEFDDGSPSVEFDVFSDNNQFTDGDIYNKMDYGVSAGLGFGMAGFFAEATIGYGLSNVFNTDNDTYKLMPDIVDGMQAAIDGGLMPGTIADYWPFMDGSTAVSEPTQKNLFFGFTVGYMLGF